MENKRVLVAFFSRAGENFFPGGLRNIEKGNTHVAAEMIAELTNGELFEIQSVDGYSESYKECVEQAKTEYGSNVRPQLKEDIDITGYDLIFIGYPNWCGTMPMPVWTFLENHDFAGKILCPFCTNEGSGLANSVADIEKLAPTADRKEGLSIKGSLVQDATPEIEAWLTNIK